jgi:hypothetical protein
VRTKERFLVNEDKKEKNYADESNQHGGPHEPSELSDTAVDEGDFLLILFGCVCDWGDSFLPLLIDYLHKDYQLWNTYVYATVIEMIK